jgi:mannose-6-phosphate isomerase-like protein (cupin superfamily)
MANDSAEDARGDLLVVQPGAGASYWQPVPANGHIEVLLAPDIVRMAQPFGLGTQTVAPGCYVREHLHDKNEEVIVVLSGSGEAELETGTHSMVPGTTLFLGRNRRHLFRNTGAQDLTFLWMILPNGLEDFFAAIGRKRVAGEPAPEPFARPADVLAIERRTVFGVLPAGAG